MRAIVSASILLLIMFGATGAVIGAQALPKWPQSFTLQPGEQTAFGIPVTQSGTLKVDVTWDGGPMSVQLLDPDGKSPDPTTPVQSPVTRTRNVTAADVQKGMIWVIRMSVPKAPAGRAVKGKVMVQPFPVDAVAFSAYVKARETKIRSEIAAIDTRMRATLSDRAVQRAKARADRLAALEKQYRAKIKPGPPIPSVTGIASARTSNKPPTQGALVKPSFAPPAVVKPKGMQNVDPSYANAVPTLISVGPQFARPDVPLTLTAKDLVPSKTWSEQAVKSKCTVLFYITPDLTLESAVLTASKSADGSTVITTETPATSGIVDPCGIYVAIQTVAWPEKMTTNPQSIQYDPFTPVLDTVVPTEGYAGDWVTVRGRNFLKSTKAFFYLKGGAPLPATFTYTSPIEGKVQTPQFGVSRIFIGQVALQNVFKKGNATGNKVDFRCLILPVIEYASPAIGSPLEIGAPLLLQGGNFQSPAQVNFYLADTMTGAHAAQVTPEYVLCQVPEFALLTLPPQEGAVSVTCAGKESERAKFTFAPEMVEEYFDPIICRNPSKNIRTAWEGTMMANHQFDVFNTCSGKDSFSADLSVLKNGWVFDHVYFENNSGGVGGGWPTLSSDVTGSPATATVDWIKYPPGGYVSYYISFIIKGPKGIPYK